MVTVFTIYCVLYHTLRNFDKDGSKIRPNHFFLVAYHVVITITRSFQVRSELNISMTYFQYR